MLQAEAVAPLSVLQQSYQHWSKEEGVVVYGVYICYTCKTIKDISVEDRPLMWSTGQMKFTPVLYLH